MTGSITGAMTGAMMGATTGTGRNALTLLTPEWPAPPGVRVVSTMRYGGVSEGPYGSLNLALHVGDGAGAVRENRRRLAQAASLPAEPLWLEQVHGVDVAIHAGSQAFDVGHDGAVRIGAPAESDPAVIPGAGAMPASVVRADAAVAFEPVRVCAVMTADCLPVVFADRAGTRVGVAHAGWRGLVGGVLEATIAALRSDPAALMAWLGPAIAPGAFEVGPEVRDAFITRHAADAHCFVVNDAKRFQADISQLARNALRRAGVRDISGGGLCTSGDDGRFFSYRRDGVTGRMATLAWIEPGRRRR